MVKKENFPVSGRRARAGDSCLLGPVFMTVKALGVDWLLVGQRVVVHLGTPTKGGRAFPENIEL